MGTDVVELFNAVYPDGPSSSPTQPSKSRIRTEIGGGLQAIIDALRALFGVSVQWKASVRAASATNVTQASITNGVSFGGVTVATGNRIAFLGQTTASQNGVFIVQASGAPVRATDADAGTEVLGMAFYVSEGTEGGRSFLCNTPGPIILGVTSLVFILLADQAALNGAISALNTAVAHLNAMTDDEDIDGIGDLTHAQLDANKRIVGGIRKSDNALVASTGNGLQPIPSPQLLDPLNGIKFNTFGTIGSPLPGSTGNPVYAALKDPDVIYVLVNMGQSLQQGMNNAAPGADLPFSTTNDRPAHVLMLNTGRFAFDTSGNPYRPTSFVPLVESDSGFGPREITSFGMAKHLFEYTLFGTGVAPVILTINAAMGGKSLRQLKRGSVYWQSMLQVIREAEQIARTTGKRLVAIQSWSQGQAEYNEGTSVAEHKRRLRLVARWFREDVHGITLQKEQPPCFIDVMSNSVAQNDPYAKTWPQPRRAHLDRPTHTPAALACGELWDDPDFCVVGTDYQFSRSGLDNTNYGIHLDSHGYFLKGQMFARAMYAELFGAGWMPTRVIKAEWKDATTLDLWFSRTITMDVSGTVVAVPDPADVIGNYRGMTFWDSSVSPPTITAAALISDQPRTDAAWVWSNSGDAATAGVLTNMAVTGIRLTLSGASTGVQKRIYIGTYKDGWYAKTATVKTSSAVSGTAYTVPNTTGIAVGDLVFGEGFATAANNGTKAVTAVTSTTVSVAGLTAEASPPGGAKITKVTVCPDGPAKGARTCIRAVDISVSLPTDQWDAEGHYEYDWAIPQVVDLTSETL